MGGRTALGRFSRRSSCGTAEDHSAEFIAQAVGRFRILLLAETLRQGKKTLLLSHLCADSILDLRIPMMSISYSDLMPIRSERSDAGLF